ncbi:MAG: Pyruvate kinase fused to PEP-utilizers swivelling domain [Haloplasmataceae bacterium]|nr:Pyruvate kinase fused to PEP-utilizers swivelling domain [Haloplasmataceae bacterium]
MAKQFKKTKIICTIGPKSESKEVMSKLVDSGMNVIRLNFSHGDYQEHGERIKTIREINSEKGTEVGLLLDTKGPEIRTGKFASGDVPTTIDNGAKVKVYMSEVLGTKEKFSITYPGLVDDVVAGGTILVDDGYLELTVLGKGEDAEGKYILTEAQNAHDVKNRRGINVPGAKLQMPFISDKDRSDIIFACEQGLDYIAASFVRRASDILEIKDILKQHNAERIQIIAKIENQEGVDNAEEILEVADGIMVARGDLGVEVPAEEVPVIQKRLIRQCNEAGKIVVTATQMLESMQKNPRPTRAEVSDVANAVLDGSDAVMLSGESAAGLYPVRAVQMQAKISQRMEEEIDHELMINRAILSSPHTIESAIGLSVADSAADLGASVIVAATMSGNTARLISKYRPTCPIIAVTPSHETARSLAINWGVIPIVVEQVNSTDELVKIAEKIAVEVAGLEKGEIAIITAGLASKNSTNLMKIFEVK